MPVVNDFVKHLLLHVDAEAATRDPSQAVGVATRAAYVRDAVRNLVGETKDNSLTSILQNIADDARGDAKRQSFRRAIASSKDVPRPHLAIQEWVRTGVDS